MVNLNKINKEYESLLLDSSKNELSELYKIMNTKLINTIGTIENGFNYDKHEQDKLKLQIEEINKILNKKYNTSEIDVNTKFNALLREYLNLQSNYITKDAYSTLSLIVNMNKDIYINLQIMELILNNLGFNYYANELASDISFFNNIIGLTVNDIDFNIIIFNQLNLNILDNDSILYADLEPVKNIIESSLVEIEEHIKDYENLKVNPFEKVVNLLLADVEDKFSGSSLQEEKNRILNNVPSYDFNNFELIINGVV